MSFMEKMMIYHSLFKVIFETTYFRKSKTKAGFSFRAGKILQAEMTQMADYFFF